MGPPFTLEKGIPQVLPVISNVTEISVPAPWVRHTYRHIALTYPATCQKLARPKDVCSISHSHSGADISFTDWTGSVSPPFPSPPTPCNCECVCVCMYVHTGTSMCVYMYRHTIFCTQEDQGVAGRQGRSTQTILASVEVSRLSPGPHWGTDKLSSRSYRQS